MNGDEQFPAAVNMGALNKYGRLNFDRWPTRAADFLFGPELDGYYELYNLGRENPLSREEFLRLTQ
jgi:hypothetical protein